MGGLAALHDVGKTTHWFDVFQNVVKIKKVKCPVFIIHGTEDREVPFDHGDDLYKAAPVKYDPWWVYEGGHNDIEVVWREDFFLRLHLFLAFLEGSPEELPTGTRPSSSGGSANAPLLPSERA